MGVFRMGAVSPEASRALIMACFADEEGAAITKRAKVLCGEVRKAAEVAEGSGECPACGACPFGLGGVFDERDRARAKLLGERPQFLRFAKEVDRDDGARFWADRFECAVD